MRGTLAIVASLILLMSMAPCSDDIAVLTGAQIDTEIGQTTPSDHEHGEEDDCSPFCSCACCKVPIWQHSFFVESVDVVFPEKK